MQSIAVLPQAPSVRDSVVNLVVHQTTGFSFKKVKEALSCGEKLVREARLQGNLLRGSALDRRTKGFVTLMHALMEAGAADAREAVERLLLREGECFRIDHERSSERSLYVQIVPCQ